MKHWQYTVSVSSPAPSSGLRSDANYPQFFAGHVLRLYGCWLHLARSYLPRSARQESLSHDLFEVIQQERSIDRVDV